MSTSTFSTADPSPPTGVSVDVTGCDSAVVTWKASMSMFDNAIGNYSVRYQLRSGGDGLTTLHESSTSVTLQGLAPNAEYNVSVAGINSCGGTSTFAMTQFNLQGTYLLYMFTGYQWSLHHIHAPTVISKCSSHTLDRSHIQPSSHLSFPTFSKQLSKLCAETW